MRAKRLNGPALHRRLKAAGRDERGATIIVFALCLVPIIGFVGLGLEYSRSFLYRARLDAAADTAAMAAITTARAYISDNAAKEANPTANAIKAGLAKAQSTFIANAGSQLRITPSTPTITLTRDGQTLNSTVTYGVSFPSPLGKLFNNANLSVSGAASASLQLETYVDFFLLLDTSGSMGFPTSKAQQVSFAALNPDMKQGPKNNCAFACHFPGWKGYDISKSNNIELRIATVGKSVQKLLDTAKASTKLTDQFRVGIYPFVSYMETAKDITPNLYSLYSTAADMESYMDLGDSDLPRGSGGTHYENVFPAINAKITRLGDGGTAVTPKAFVFLVTDGMANNQYWRNSSGWTGSQANLLDPSICQPLKTRGVTISILYVPYEPLVKPFNKNVEDENERVNSLIPSVPDTLRSCASPNYFRTASTATEITAAMDAMFQQAVAAARLTR